MNIKNKLKPPPRCVYRFLLDGWWSFHVAVPQLHRDFTTNSALCGEVLSWKKKVVVTLTKSWYKKFRFISNVQLVTCQSCQVKSKMKGYWAPCKHFFHSIVWYDIAAPESCWFEPSAQASAHLSFWSWSTQCSYTKQTYLIKHITLYDAVCKSETEYLCIIETIKPFNASTPAWESWRLQTKQFLGLSTSTFPAFQGPKGVDLWEGLPLAIYTVQAQTQTRKKMTLWHV